MNYLESDIMRRFFELAINLRKPVRLMNGETAYIKFILPQPYEKPDFKYVGYRLAKVGEGKADLWPTMEYWDAFGRAESSKDADIWGLQEEFNIEYFQIR